MNGLLNFIADPKVHDTVLGTMLVTSFIGAIRRFPAPSNWYQTAWNFLYDWLVGFWSLKTGKPLPETHIQTTQETPQTKTTQDVTIQNPIPPGTDPAKP